MRFLLDENIPPSLALLLQSIGHEARHVNQIGYNNTPDFKIADFAANSGDAIITHDTDFGTILALSGNERPSVVLFRWQTISAQRIFQFFEAYLSKFSEELSAGALVIVDENKIRIRTLPLDI